MSINLGFNKMFKEKDTNEHFETMKVMLSWHNDFRFEFVSLHLFLSFPTSILYYQNSTVDQMAFGTPTPEEKV